MKPKNSDFVIQKWFDGELDLNEFEYRFPSGETAEFLKRRNELEEIRRLIKLYKKHFYPINGDKGKVWSSIQAELFGSRDQIIKKNRVFETVKKRRGKKILVACLLLLFFVSVGYSFNVLNNKKLDASKSKRLRMNKVIENIDKIIRAQKMGEK